MRHRLETLRNAVSHALALMFTDDGRGEIAEAWKDAFSGSIDFVLGPQVLDLKNARFILS